MTSTIPTIQSASLQYREGNSDKEYHAAIEPKGEAVGDTLHAFDLLESKGHDLRQRRYIERFAGLMMAIPPTSRQLRRDFPIPNEQG